MLLLVFFQFCPFYINQFNLPVKVFFNSIIFLYLFFKVAFFLVNGLFFLANPVFSIADFLVLFEHFFIMRSFHLHKFFLGFQFFFFPDGFGPELSFPDDGL